MHGFTLVETMVVAAIAVLLVTMAVPAMIPMIERNRLNAKASELSAAISLARSEAIKRGANERVTLTPNTAGDWTSGWSIFLDTTDDANGEKSPAKTASNVLQYVEKLPGSIVEKVDCSSGNSSCSRLGYVSFRSTGEAMVNNDEAKTTTAKEVGGYQKGVVAEFKSGSQSRCIKLVPPGIVDISIDSANCP